MTPAFYEIRNWREFQHYSQRNPPWIKLHFEILTSRDWVVLADASKLVAVVCMLLASRNGGRVPNDPDYIAKAGHLKCCDLKPLVECGFLSSLADASGCKQTLAGASTKTDGYSEAYAEAEADISPEPRRPRSAPVDDTPVIGTIQLADGSDFAITERMAEPWRPAYPGCDIPREIAKARAWCLANPTKRKTRRGAMKFMVGWLERSQNSGRSGGAVSGGIRGDTASASIEAGKQFLKRFGGA